MDRTLLNTFFHFSLKLQDNLTSLLILIEGSYGALTTRTERYSLARADASLSTSGPRMLDQPVVFLPCQGPFSPD